MKTLNPFNRLKSFRKNLGTRVFIIVSINIIVMTSVFVGFFLQYEQNDHRAVLIKKGESLLGTLAHNSRLGIFSENKGLLTDPVAGILQDTEVAAAYVFALDGNMLISQEKILKNIPEANISGRAEDVMLTLKKLRESPHTYYTESPIILDFWAPVSIGRVNAEESLFSDGSSVLPTEGRTIGFVRILIDKTTLKQELRRLLFKNLVIGIVFLISSLGISFVVVRSITRPLNRLTTAVLNFGAKGSVEKVDIETEDEIGSLAKAFNEMTEALSKRQLEKDQLEVHLRHSQKQEAVGQLAGGVAHDFNNILTAIISYGTVLQMKLEAEDPLRQTTERILAAAGRAAVLTQSLLAFSRKQPVNLRALDLNELIRKGEKLLARLIREDIEFKVHLASEALIVMGDPGQIEQVLMNLITNARDAMPEGGILSIDTKVTMIDSEFASKHGYGDPGRYALMTVSDTGIGMDKEVQAKIFEPFFTTKEVGKGTGLGLAIVYGIIKQHKGFINVYSEPGVGTTFNIYLPAVKSDIEKMEQAEAQPPRGGTETILLAEDDEEVRNITRTFFEEFGYKVISAKDGVDAINKFTENRDNIKLAILDVIMPRKNGKEVYDRIISEKPNMKVLFVSGYTADIINEKGLLHEGLEFMSKPVSPAALLKKVREVLDK